MLFECLCHYIPVAWLGCLLYRAISISEGELRLHSAVFYQKSLSVSFLMLSRVTFRIQQKVIPSEFLKLPPFDAFILDTEATDSPTNKEVTSFRSSIACAAVSLIVASLGLLPSSASKFTVAKSLGRSWSRTAIEATCSHLLKVW